MPGVFGHGQSGHTWIHPDCALIRTISQGANSGLYPTSMPAFDRTLTQDQIVSIIAYLETWWTPEQRLFRKARSMQEPVCPN